MKYFICCIAVLLSTSALAQPEDEYQPEWIFSPFNIGAGFFYPDHHGLSDSLHAAGYGRLPSPQDAGGLGLELFHKSHLVLSFSLNATGPVKDTALKGRGYYNMIRETRYINSSFSIGYNIFPIHKVPSVVLSPKIGIYLSRLKVSTSNFYGDSLLLPSVYGAAPQEDKTLRLWESGVQAAVKFSCSPFLRSRSMFAMVGFGLEGGVQYNTGLITHRSHDAGRSQAILLPSGANQSMYFRFEIQLLRGAWHWE